jgi:preprotein translocase subunit SecE
MTAVVIGSILGIVLGFTVTLGLTLWVLDQLVDSCCPGW